MNHMKNLFFLLVHQVASVCKMNYWKWILNLYGSFIYRDFFQYEKWFLIRREYSCREMNEIRTEKELFEKKWWKKCLLTWNESVQYRNLVKRILWILFSWPDVDLLFVDVKLPRRIDELFICYYSVQHMCVACWIEGNLFH